MQVEQLTRLVEGIAARMNEPARKGFWKRLFGSGRGKEPPGATNFSVSLFQVMNERSSLMKSELTAFLDTIDTPAFRRANLAKVRAKAAAAQCGPVPAAVQLARLGLTGAPFQVPSRSGE